MSSAHRRQTVTLVPAAVQRTFVLGELEHMLSHVDSDEVTAVAGEGASSGERLRATVAVAKRYRTPGVDPAEDIVDPYGRSDAVYLTSFRQIQAALEPLVRLLAAAPRSSG
jgi:protein-tyrosine phosphatase